MHKSMHNLAKKTTTWLLLEASAAAVAMKAAAVDRMGIPADSPPRRRGMSAGGARMPEGSHASRSVSGTDV